MLNATFSRPRRDERSYCAAEGLGRPPLGADREVECPLQPAPRMNLRSVISALFASAPLVLALAVPSKASACASCGCGDPTLTSMGVEQPFLGRLRGATLLRYWGENSGGHHGTPGESLRELRLDVSASYAPLSWLQLAVTLPLHARELSGGVLEPQRALSPGDVELGARFLVWQNREFSPEHLVSALVGVKLPTAPRQQDASGELWDADAQVGSGSVDPRVGAAYAFFAAPWSLYTSLVLQWPTEGFEGHRAPRSLRGSVAGQYQLGAWLALRLGVDTRLDGLEAHHGEPEPGTAGFIAYAAPDLLFSPRPDTAVQLGVRVPLLATFEHGHPEERPVLSLAFIHDF